MIGPAGFMAGPKQRRQKQPDLLDHTPDKLAKTWRAAAEKSREQFPLDESRAQWYER